MLVALCGARKHDLVWAKRMCSRVESKRDLKIEYTREYKGVPGLYETRETVVPKVKYKRNVCSVHTNTTTNPVYIYV